MKTQRNYTKFTQKSVIGLSLMKQFIEEKHKKIGQNVAKIRKERGLSQLELSLRLGHKSVSIVASAERFYRGAHFSLTHLLEIAEILEVDVREFFKEL